MTVEAPDPWGSETGINAPPVFALMAAVLAAVVVNWIVPWDFGLRAYVRLPIAILLALPLAIIIPGVERAFLRAGTDSNVRRQPAALVTDGFFRHSRNPSYVAFTLAFLAIPIAFNIVWGVIFVPIAFVFVHFTIVLREEELLEKRFGEDYLQYKRRVRRWI